MGNRMQEWMEKAMQDRVETILKELLQKNGDYAAVMQRHQEYMEQIFPIINRNADITLSPEDLAGFDQCMQNYKIALAIERYALYLEGYKDCCSLLKSLSIL